MEKLSDDEFDHVRDFDTISDDESEAESGRHITPSTTPTRTLTPRPSNRKIIACTFEGCPKTFNRNARLQEHLRSHTGERPFTCPHDGCGKAFLRNTHLKHHLTSAHSDIRKYTCEHEGCAKSFATGTRLRRHHLSHEGKEKFRCRDHPPCAETFRKHETLRKHVLEVHQGKRPFPCGYLVEPTQEKCGQAFTTREKLQLHQRSSHDPTRFSCNICAQNATQACFATFSELQVHMADVHPPTCPYCPTSFTSNKQLTRHLEVQHGLTDSKKEAKQFSCTHPHCDRVFSKRGNLTVHINTVHDKQKEFVCGATIIPVPEEVIGQYISAAGCGRAFTSKATLIEHVRTAHFQLPSMRSQRELRRKVKRELEDDDGADSSRSSSRRRLGGVKKQSALSQLSGLDFCQPSPPPGISHDPLTEDLTQTQFLVPTSPGPLPPSSMGTDSSSFNQLSGSVTMFGSHIYRNGRPHHLLQNDDEESAIAEDPQYVPCHPSGPTADPWHDFEDDLFAFDHEAELVHPQTLIDPQLLLV